MADELAVQTLLSDWERMLTDLHRKGITEQDLTIKLSQVQTIIEGYRAVQLELGQLSAKHEALDRQHEDLIEELFECQNNPNYRPRPTRAKG
jgi:hypothetical protein